MALIPEWRLAPRFSCTWVALSGVVWAFLPSGARAIVLAATRLDDAQMVAVFCVAFMVARLWRQPDLEVVKRGL